jgi:hypothetical protein
MLRNEALKTSAEQEWFAMEQVNDLGKLSSRIIADDFVRVRSASSLGNATRCWPVTRRRSAGGLSEDAGVVAHALTPNVVMAKGVGKGWRCR